MPKIYKQNCKECNKYYERPGAKYFCSLPCANVNEEHKQNIGKGNIGKIRSKEFKLGVSKFQKGKKWHLGKKLSEETKKKIGNAHRGKPRSKETKRKLSETRKILFKEGKLFFVNPFRKGHKHSQESIKKAVETRMKNYKKENHYNWKGGLSYLPYPSIFDKNLKNRIKERDSFICQLCGKTEQEELDEIGRVLCVNHIDFNKDNCSEENLNTLCVRCNVRINYDRDKYTKFFQERMFYGI